MRLSIILPLILLLASPAAWAAMYKWKDQDGNTQYGQFPPAGVEAQAISPNRQPAAATRTTSTPQQRLEELEKKQQEQQESDAKAAKAGELEEQRKANCRISQENLLSLQRGGHHRVRMPDGTVTYLDEPERQRRIEEAREIVEKDCD